MVVKPYDCSIHTILELISFLYLILHVVICSEVQYFWVQVRQSVELLFKTWVVPSGPALVLQWTAARQWRSSFVWQSLCGLLVPFLSALTMQRLLPVQLLLFTSWLVLMFNISMGVVLRFCIIRVSPVQVFISPIVYPTQNAKDPVRRTMSVGDHFVGTVHLYSFTTIILNDKLNKILMSIIQSTWHNQQYTCAHR